MEEEEKQKIRKNILKVRQKERADKMNTSSDYKLTRKEIICKVSVAYFLLIKKFTEKVKHIMQDENHSLKTCRLEEFNQASLIFLEQNYLKTDKARKN